MADQIDSACLIEDFARSTQIALCEREAAKPIPTSEFCYHCDEPTVGGSRWCDADCQIDYTNIKNKV